MQIKVVSYIDPEKLNKTTNKTEQKPTTTSETPSSSTVDFSASLKAAKNALTGITVDLATSGDADLVKQAAEMLRASSTAKLQKLGTLLLNCIPSDTETTEANTDGTESSSALESVTTGDSAAEEPTATGNASATEDVKTDNSNTAETSKTDSPTTAEVSKADSSNATEEVGKSQTNESEEASSSSSCDPRVVRHDLSQASERLGCPEELQPYFQEASETYGVDVAFLEAIALAESSFNPNDVSHAGAVGVMQLMPGTASDLGVEDSYDPYQNIMGGAKLISSLLDKYDGDSSLALAAYNAGSGNVKKYGGIPPFEETQRYVPKVLGFYEKAIA